LAELIREDPRLADLRVITLTSRATDTEQYRELNLSSQLLKPIKRSELFTAVASALGADRQMTTLARNDQTDEIGVGPLRILLAEDGLANRKLAMGVLAQSGHIVISVSNGKEAVEAWENQQLDLILMDVQMPEMDGLEATRTIRASERQSGHHVPIVAMTAHAMQGDREKCLVAGMDDYIAKPVRKAVLNATIKRILRSSEATALPRLDITNGLEATGGNEKLLREVLQVFVEECPILLRQLKQAVENLDAPSVERLAHTLKGSLRICERTPAQTIAAELECQARNKDLSGSSAKVDSLRDALNLLTPRIQEYLRS
jgi:CheY-like chemotaxis protein